MNKINIRLVSFIIFAILLFILVIYLVFIYSTKGNKQNEAINNSPAAQANKAALLINENVMGLTLDQTGQNLLYFKLSDDDNNLAFFKYSLANNTETKISQPMHIPEAILWSPKKDKIIISNLYDQFIFQNFPNIMGDPKVDDGSLLIWYYNFTTQKIALLDPSITNISWAPDDNKIVYGDFDGKSSNITTADSDGANPQIIKTAELSMEAMPGYISANIMYYYPAVSEANGFNLTELNLSDKSAHNIINDNTCAWALADPYNDQQLLYGIFHPTSETTLGLISVDGKNKTDVGIQTSIDKIDFGSTGKFIIAAEPQSDQNDKVYKVDLATKQKTEIAYSTDTKVSPTDLAISKDGKNLYFISDKNLYQIKIN